MPQTADFIFFLQDKQNRFWGLNAAGEVVLNSNPYPLVFSPDGWEDINIKNVRNKKYWAIDRTVSLALKYVEDGAKILKHIFYKKGPEESVFLTICELNLEYTAGVSYKYWYKRVFKSEIDLSTFQHSGPLVTCTTLEDGLAKHLKANENTVYEFDLTEKVKADGIILHEQANYRAVDGFELLKSDTGSTFIMPMSFINKDGNNSPIVFTESPLNSVIGLTVEEILVTDYYFATLPKWWHTSLDLTMTGNLIFTVNQRDPTATFKLRLLKTGQTTANQDDNVLITSSPLVVGTTYTIPIDKTVTMNPGDKLFIQWVYIMANPSAVEIKIQFEPESDFAFEYDYRYKTTYVPFARPQYLFTEFITRMTEGEYSAEDCPYFGELQNWNKVFTSGDAARGITEAKMKMSFSDFFGFWDGPYDAVGIRELDKRILFDRKAALTDMVNLISLGEISNPVIDFDKALPFNELAIGYPDVKNEAGMLNGKNEVNTTFNFSMGTTKSPRKLDKVSKIKASCYDFENARFKATQSNTTDSKSDNDLFVLHIGNTLITGSGDIPNHYELDRTYNAFVTGVDQAATMFNLALSPKNGFIRSGDYLRSLGYKIDNKVLKFTSADRNAGMAYINGATVIVENANVPVGSLAAPFFTPVVITVDTDAPEDLLSLLDANPIQGFTWTFEGTTYTGISIENSVNPKTNKRQTYTLLSHPDNDLTKLIKYHG